MNTLEGTCLCGCGGTTGMQKEGRSVDGIPSLWLPGHNRRGIGGYRALNNITEGQLALFDASAYDAAPDETA